LDNLKGELDNMKRESDNMKRELDSCRANIKASPKKPSTCLKGKWGEGWYELKNGMTLASYKNACNADPKCLSYSSSAIPVFIIVFGLYSGVAIWKHNKS
jgi:hypothetical protein